MKTEFKRLLQLFPLMSLAVAGLCGVFFWGGFNWSLEVTNTERFCISCHAMRENVYKELEKTVHFKNRSGVRATCPDCHVPKEWIYKVVRKVRATGEIYHWLVGTISTPEKFEARRQALAQHVWKTMKANNSRECRNCHIKDSMKFKIQSPRAAKMHELGTIWEYTCIDCHRGIAHNLPAGHNNDKIIAELHVRIEAEDIVCRDCHVDMAGGPVGDDGWAKE